jgi:hypothetical protein
MANSASETRKYNFSQEVCYKASITAIEYLGWVITNNINNVITANVPTTMSSWGETISVRVNESGQVSIVSQCNKNQIFDWGKNKRNIASFITKLDDVIELVFKESQMGTPETINISKKQDVDSNIPEQIEKLATLRDKGIISSEEFDSKKGELLNRM